MNKKNRISEEIVGLHAQENPETRAGINTPTHYNITSITSIT